MSFEWLGSFLHNVEKADDYAEKTLASYALGMKGKGAIAGVRVEVAEDCCDAARVLAAGEIYDPESAPRIPLPDCTRDRQCTCVYRPVMLYEAKNANAKSAINDGGCED